MRRVPRLTLALVLGACLGAWPPALLAAEPALEGLDGDRLTTADLERGVVILVVWASWSPRCRDVVPRINALERSWRERARLASVVFQEKPETVRRFLAGKGLRPAVYVDATGAFSKRHAVTQLPALLVFRGGRAAYRGKLPADPDRAIERALED